jgi:D,D-heptose 1,7-bisphosphate phosphatase
LRKTSHPLRKAVFLDRDGTVTVDTVFSVDPAKFEPLPGTVEGLKRLQDAGYLLIVITNQSGVARGHFSEEGLRAFHDHFIARFREVGVAITEVYYCPHHTTGTVARYVKACDCRKPAPGMILRAAREHGIDLAASWMIGDRDCDIGAGRAAGCRTIRIGTTPEGETKPDFEAGDVAEAAERILTRLRG